MGFSDGLDGGRTPFTNTALCDCGSAWFRLEAFVSSDEKGVGAVSLDGEGNITSYSGIFVCIECGERIVLPQAVDAAEHARMTGRSILRRVK